jgi:hypothetical protein
VRIASRPRRAALAALGVGAAALAGCGGSGSAKALSKSEYIARADGICASGNAKVAPYKAQLDRLTSAGDPQQVFTKAPGIIRRATRQTAKSVDALAALRGPAADAAALRGWVAGIRRQEQLLEQSATAFERRDVGRVKSLSVKLGRLDRTANAFAGRYGMRECAKQAS